MWYRIIWAFKCGRLVVLVMLCCDEKLEEEDYKYVATPVIAVEQSPQLSSQTAKKNTTSG